MAVIVKNFNVGNILITDLATISDDNRVADLFHNPKTNWSQSSSMKCEQLPFDSLISSQIYSLIIIWLN